MDNTLQLIIFFVSAVFLIQSSTTVVRRLSRIAKFLQVSEFFLSFVLVAVATSLPDIFVGISAAIHGKPELSFSNIIGANIITLTLAAGLAAIFAKGLLIKGETIRRDTIIASIAAILPVLLLLDRSLSRVDGIILIAFVSWYFAKLIFQRERFTKIFHNNNGNLFGLKQFLIDLAVAVLAMIILVGSAEFIIRSSLEIALGFGIPLHFIGIILVAASITLPEIAFGTRAIMMGHRDMVMGNLIGSIVINSGIALGFTAIIKPIIVDTFAPFLIGIIFTIVVALGFWLFSYSGRKISAREGIVLIAIYALFIFLVIYQGRTI